MMTDLVASVRSDGLGRSETSAPWQGRRHVLDLDDFSRPEIERVLETADRMKEILRRQRDLPAKELVAKIRQAVRDHTGTDAREDDLTLVAAKVT